MPPAGYLAAVLLLVLSWGLGGGTVWGSWAAGAGGWLAWVLCLIENIRRGRPGHAFPLAALPWLLLILYLGISIWNQSFQPRPEPPAGFSRLPPGVDPSEDRFLSYEEVDHISWLPSAVNRQRTFRYAFALSGAFAFAVALCQSRWRRRGIRRFFALVFANTVVLAVAGTVSAMINPEAILGSISPDSSQPFATFHYKNIWTGWLFLGTGAGLALCAWELRRGGGLLGKRSLLPVYALPLVLLPLTGALAQSRAAVLLTALLFGWLVTRWLWSLMRRRMLVLRSVAAAVVGLLIATAGALVVANDELRRNWDKTEVKLEGFQDQGVFDSRQLLIRDTAKMGAARPVFGWGLASFPQVFGLFQGLDLYERVDFPNGDFIWLPRLFEFAHCDWIQYWAELGSVGFVLLVVPGLVFFVYTLGKGRANPVSHWLNVGSLLVLLLATFEFPFGSEAVTLLFAACVVLAGNYRLLSRDAALRSQSSARRKTEALSTQEKEAAGALDEGDDLEKAHGTS